MNTLAEQLDFSGDVIWVTGAGSGIGKETATVFHALGAEVHGFDCRFADAHYPFIPHVVDLSDAADIARCGDALLAQIPRINVLVNAAGVLRTGSLASLTADDWQATFAVNVHGVFHLLQRLLPLFKRQRFGAIVNVASNAAHVPRMEMAAYCASKAALRSLSHCLALELAAYGVRSNLVSPGSTDTPMLHRLLPDDSAMARTISGSLATYKNGIPLGKLASPRDIANAIVFLASDLAGHITLQDLVVDGGATLSA